MNFYGPNFEQINNLDNFSTKIKYSCAQDLKLSVFVLLLYIRTVNIVIFWTKCVKLYINTLLRLYFVKKTNKQVLLSLIRLNFWRACSCRVLCYVSMHKKEKMYRKSRKVKQM